MTSENLRTRIVALEKNIYRTNGRRAADSAGEGEAWASAFSKREYALISLGFAVVMALIKVVEFLGEKVWHLVAAAH